MRVLLILNLFFSMKKYIVTLAMALMVGGISHAQDEAGLYMNNRTPLITKTYMELPLGAVRPEGWLKDQMQRMTDGMTGHLDELYTKVMGPRNGWLGGDGDVWERGPYWIDGS